MRAARILLLVLLAPVFARAETISGTTTQVASGPVSAASFEYPFVAWVDVRSGNVLYFDERDGSTHTIGAGDEPSVGNGQIVFVCGAARNVCMFDPATQQTTQMTSDSNDYGPSVSSQLLAWIHFPSPQDYPVIEVMDRSTQQIVSLPYEPTSISVKGRLVMYAQQAGSPSMSLGVYDEATGINHGIASASDGIYGGFDGSHVVYSLSEPGGDYTFVADLSGQIISSVSGGLGGTISGDWVPIVTGDPSNGTSELNLWRWTTGDVFSTEVPHPDGTGGPSADEMTMNGSRVVWNNFDGTRNSDAIYSIDFGSPTTSTVSFSDNFDACTSTSDLGPKWTVDGTWYCKAERARGESTRDLALANTAGMQDTDVSALVQLDNDDMSGIVARAQGDSYYAARLRSSNYVELIRVNGGNVQVIASQAMPIDQYVSYTMGLHVTGTDPVQLSVDVNGSQVLAYSDSSSSRLYGGLAGLMHGTGYRTQFDNFVLDGSAPSFSGGSVQPPPPPPPASVSFSDDFDACPDGAALDANWELHGDFYCKAQRARGEQAQGIALAKTDAMTDTDVKAYVQLDSNDGSGVVARAQGNSYYAMRLRSSGAVDIVRVNDGAETVLTSNPASIANETSYTMELRVTGSNPVYLTGELNGGTVLAVEDTSPSRLASGDAGILHGGGFRTQFDDFVLTGTTSSTSNPPPPPPSGSVSFSDDFDACADNASLGGNWIVTGTWYCKSQRARGESAMGIALANTANLGDTDVSALVQLNGSSGSGVVARDDGGSYYAARLLSVGGRAQIIRVDGGPVTVLADVPWNVAANTSYVIELQVTGTSPAQLSMSIGGTPVASATDASAFQSGLAGLLSGADARTQYDDFTVSGTAAP